MRVDMSMEDYLRGRYINGLGDDDNHYRVKTSSDIMRERGEEILWKLRCETKFGDKSK